MRKFVFLFFATAVFYPALADTFIVTSNADSGPGTLRQAVILANANGTTATDYINFNIADVSIAGRTILLLTQIPDLSSNIIIDGTTQPGLNIGVSNAKIRISNPPGIGVECIFNINNSSNISFYGLHFTAINILTNTVAGGNAIELHNASSISIGDAGKGNYFTNLNTGVANSAAVGRGMSSNISFKANIVNLTEDGTALATNSSAIAISLTNVTNADIGGTQPGEGNYMSIEGNGIIQIATDTIANLNTGYINVINNRLGCDYAETKSINCGTIYLQNAGTFGTDTTNITVKGNHYYNSYVYSFSNKSYDFLFIQNKNGFIDIKANRINTLTATSSSSLVPNAITIIGCQNGIIGGDNAGDTNYIAGSIANGISISNNKNIRITKNSIYCNFNGILAASTFVVVPKTEIFTLTDYDVKGTTLANSVVEIFITKTCGCNNGETYLGNTVADGAGNWSFTSTLLLDGPVTATSTSSLGVTGQFSKPEYIAIDPDTKEPSCNQNNGYIHGIHFVAGTKYYWTRRYNNITDTIFSENLDNLGPGDYNFIVEQGKYCSVNYSTSLTDLSPKIDSQNISIINPSCGQSNGSIHSISVSGSYNKLTWRDAANNIVGNTADLNNIAPGKYKLILLDTINACADSTGYFILTNQFGPLLNTNNMQIIPATCSNNNGSITGITATNVTSTPFIEWVDSLNKPVGYNYDLTNVVAGKYRFKFKDGSNCDTIITSFYIVTGSAFAAINVTAFTVRNALCAQPDGTIKITSFSKDVGSYNFYWTDSSSGQTIGNGTALFNLDAGTYLLIATDSNGCKKSILSSTIKSVPVPSFNYSQVLLNNDVCNLHEGSITALQVNGLTGPDVYTWYDLSNNIAGNTLALENVAAGNYILKITDDSVCNIQSTPFTITNSNVELPVPVYDDLVIQRYSDAQINIKNAAAGSYNLSFNASLTPVVQQNNSGNFIVPKVSADTSVYIQRISGDCSSSIVKVSIKVIDKSFFAVATAFTPNGDGKNDLLHVKVIGLIQLTYFRIFNRWGHMIFETRNINDGWDGRINGVAQETGGFMWTAQGKDINGNTLSSKGSFILIR